MTKYRVISSDPPWPFDDKLAMSKVKRGAEANYDTLSIQDIKDLPVKDLADDDSILVLWCPSTLLEEGLDVMKSWGFEFRQTHIWVKTKKEPFEFIKKFTNKLFGLFASGTSKKEVSEMLDKFLWTEDNLKDSIENDEDPPPSMEETLGFGMGHLFRQTHEVALVGIRGKIYKHLKNKSQRSVHFWPTTKHSVKPETLQDMLEIMFPEGDRLEMFARRARDGWDCIGNECPSSMGEDIRDSLKELTS